MRAPSPWVVRRESARKKGGNLASADRRTCAGRRRSESAPRGPFRKKEISVGEIGRQLDQTSLAFLGRPLPILSKSPYAWPSLRADSIIMKLVGNQIGRASSSFRLVFLRRIPRLVTDLVVAKPVRMIPVILGHTP